MIPANDNAPRYREGFDAGLRCRLCLSQADYPGALNLPKSASDPFFLGWAHALEKSA